ncbi:MAG: hypothetical protein P4L87_08165 [Formivibrio sp.]|nr:hypothetical protein [Formivibrio sp.]
MQQILDYLIHYADTVLARYRDPYHGTPLFFDGCDSVTGKPVSWRYIDGTEWELSNIASQQNLFRFLTALTTLTGDPKYKQAAKEAIAWHFEHADASGLIHWGGHCFLDLKTLQTVGPENKNQVHELKHHCPFYELMYEVNPKATSRLIKAIWNSHISDWDIMEMSRHGEFGKPLDEATIWNKPQHADLEPLREMKGLSFVNIGNDLIYAAGMLYQLEGDTQALGWGEFLASQYVNSRHPMTKLGVYQFNRPLKRDEPPKDENDPEFTYSFWGDRAERQFGPEYGPVAKEAWVLFKMDEEALNGPEGIYGDSALAQTQLARQLGARGKKLLEWTTEGLEAWAKYAYVPETNETRPMFADGKDLTGQLIPRFGFFGKKGVAFTRRPVSPLIFLSYVTNWSVSRSEKLWPVVCCMAKHFGLGEWSGNKPAVNLQVQASDALFLIAALEMYRATGLAAYLELAQALGGNVFHVHAHRGLFTASSKHVYCRFDDIEPLALITLVATLQGKGEAMPVFRGKGGYIHGDMLLPDGTKKNTMDILAIYPRTQD